MNTTLRTLIAGLLLVLCFGMGQAVVAQTGHTLVVKEGKVFLDGEALPAESLPPQINLEGLEASLSYAGDAKPLLEVNGILYTVEEKRLVVVEDGQLGPGRVSVFFREGALAPGSDQDNALRFSGDQVPVFVRDEPAVAAFEEIGGTVQKVYSQEADLLAQKARLNAHESAMVAQWLPRITVQSYLQDVQNQNTALYERLVQESRMDAEAQGLAAEIRGMQDGAERDALISSLQKNLDAIFEMKQQNRRREIEQLEQQLTELQSRLEKREAYRQRIIEQRLHELIGEPNPRDW